MTNLDADLRSIVVNGAPAFALLSRPRSGGGDRLEVLAGDPVEVAHLADLPAAEAAETRAKAEALLRALGGRHAAATGEVRRAVPIGYRLRRALAAHNRGLSDFWRGREHPRPAPPLAGRRLLMIDAEDDFTAMLATVAASTGLDVRLQRFDRDLPDGADLVLVGPGPGDPRDRADPRIARLHEITRDLLASGTPFLAVCLGHQVLADVLGLPIRRLKTPRQGLQQTISRYGRPERVGFYNTFVATSGRIARTVRSPVSRSASCAITRPAPCAR